MAAPQIPNLLSLRGRGDRRGGRGALTGTDSDPTMARKQQDEIVQATDTDANISRLSAVKTGYLEDPFAIEFIPSSVLPDTSRRLPIINRGTYLRTTAVDRVVRTFLDSSSLPKQIISLGAGTDTRFFRFTNDKLLGNCTYHELDFPKNAQKKVEAIQRSDKLKSFLDAEAVFSVHEIHASRYHLHGVDLRLFDTNHPDHASRTELKHVSSSLPTLILSECCLIYLQPDTADAVLRYLTTTVLQPNTPRGLVLYEPINPFDAFGKVMVSNLAARGIVLRTLHKYSSLEAQKARLKMYGFQDGQEAIDIYLIQKQWIDDAEKERISSLEMLDEVEELNMLMQHYCVAWAWYDGKEKGIWNRWSNLA